MTLLCWTSIRICRDEDVSPLAEGRRGGLERFAIRRFGCWSRSRFGACLCALHYQKDGQASCFTALIGVPFRRGRRFTHGGNQQSLPVEGVHIGGQHAVIGAYLAPQCRVLAVRGPETLIVVTLISRATYLRRCLCR